MEQREGTSARRGTLALAGLLAAACTGPQPTPERAWNHAPELAPVEPLESAEAFEPDDAGSTWTAEAVQPTREPRVALPAGAPHTVEPPPLPRTPAFVPGEAVLGAVVWDQSDCAIGAVDDLLLDLRTGAVVTCHAAAAVGQAAPLSTGPLALPGSTLTWVAAESGLCVRAGGQVPSIPHPPPPVPASHEELFAERAPQLLEGVITQIGPLAAGSGLVVLRLREASNLLHRVLLCPAAFLQSAGMPLEEGAAVSVEGLATRDELGKLWIASRLRRGELDLRLRDAAGKPLWPESAIAASVPHDALPEPVLVRSLVGASVRTADEQELPLRGFVLDPARGEVPFVRIAVDEAEHLLPISALGAGPQGAWRIALTRAELAEQPVLSPLGVLQPHGDH
jgi:hypothetical protein